MQSMLKKDRKLAMEDPGDLKTIDLIAAKLAMRVEPYLATSLSMKIAFKEYKKIFTKNSIRSSKSPSQRRSRRANVKDIGKMAEYVPIIAITDGLMEYAVALGASDIHIERLPEKVLVRYRVDGILRDIVQLPKEIDDAIIARIKNTFQLADRCPFHAAGRPIQIQA